MTTVTRSTFDHKLVALQDGVLRLAELVETQLVEAGKALQNRDTTRARRVAEFDSTINQERYHLEEEAYTLIALQQPTSRDMRRLVSVVSVVTNLERMADHAAGIARLVLRMENQSSNLYLSTFNDMITRSVANLRDAMRAFAMQDAELARQINVRDDQIDLLHKQTYDQLVATMTSEPSSVECATMLLWVSHNIERFADRVSNICDRVIYTATGELGKPRHDDMP